MGACSAKEKLHVQDPRPIPKHPSKRPERSPKVSQTAGSVTKQLRARDAAEVEKEQKRRAEEKRAWLAAGERIRIQFRVQQTESTEQERIELTEVNQRLRLMLYHFLYLTVSAAASQTSSR